MTPTAPDTGYAADLTALEGRGRTLSAAVGAALRSTVPDATAVRACGRALGLDKNLAWKIVNLASAADIATVLSCLPGRRGWRKTIEALAASACDPRLVEDLRIAIAAFDDEIATRGIDRTTLAAMAAGGLDSERSLTEFRRLREQATLANAVLWGTEACVSGATYLVVPSSDDDERDLLDILSLSWRHGLHRTGPGPRCRVFMATSAYAVDDSDAVLGAPLSTDGPPRLIPELSSPTAARELHIHRHDGRSHVFLDGAGTSPTRPIDLVFAERLPRAAYVHARQDGELGTFGAAQHLPSRWAVLEVLVHRSIAWSESPEAATYSQITGPAPRNHWSDVQRLPMAEIVRSGSPVDLPDELRDHRERHRRILTFAAERLDRSLADFTAHQVVVPFPVLSSNLLLRWRLPSPPPRRNDEQNDDPSRGSNA